MTVLVWLQCGSEAITSIRHGMVPFTTWRTAAYTIEAKPDTLVADLPGAGKSTSIRLPSRQRQSKGRLPSTHQHHVQTAEDQAGQRHARRAWEADEDGGVGVGSDLQTGAGKMANESVAVTVTVPMWS